MVRGLGKVHAATWNGGVALSGGGHYLCRRLHRVRRPSSTAEVSHKRQQRTYDWWWWCGRVAKITCLSVPHGSNASHSGGRTPGSQAPGVPRHPRRPPPGPRRPSGRSPKTRQTKCSLKSCPGSLVRNAPGTASPPPRGKNEIRPKALLVKNNSRICRSELRWEIGVHLHVVMVVVVVQTVEQRARVCPGSRTVRCSKFGAARHLETSPRRLRHPTPALKPSPRNYTISCTLQRHERASTSGSEVHFHVRKCVKIG